MEIFDLDIIISNVHFTTKSLTARRQQFHDTINNLTFHYKNARNIKKDEIRTIVFIFTGDFNTRSFSNFTEDNLNRSSKKQRRFTVIEKTEQ